MVITWTQEELDFMKIKKKPYKESRITSSNPADESNKDRFSLSAHWVDITCSEYKQDILCTISGKKGSGKSYGSLRLAKSCAIKTAIKLDNDEKQWENYFTIDNVAIMDVDKMLDLLQRNDKHQVYIFDDVGTMQGARQYKSETNQVINNTLVSNRTLNSIILSSAPETRHQDKQARDLGEWQCDFQRNEALMSKGMSIAKPLIRVTDPKTSESYFKFPYWKGAKIERILLQKPDKELCEEYDKLREIGRNKIQDKLVKALSEEEESAGQPRVHKNQARAEERIREAQERVNQYHLAGMTRKEAVSTMCGELKIPKQVWYNWVSQGKAVEPPKN